MCINEYTFFGNVVQYSNELKRTMAPCDIQIQEDKGYLLKHNSMCYSIYEISIYSEMLACDLLLFRVA